MKTTETTTTILETTTVRPTATTLTANARTNPTKTTASTINIHAKYKTQQQQRQTKTKEKSNKPIKHLQGSQQKENFLDLHPIKPASLASLNSLKDPSNLDFNFFFADLSRHVVLIVLYIL